MSDSALRDPAEANQQPDSAQGGSAVPGAVNRVSFLEEQQRRRRQGRLLSALCALAAMVMSIPLGMLITPPLFLLLVLLAKIVSAIIPMPEPVWTLLRDWAQIVPDLLEAIAEPEMPRRLSGRGLFLGVLWLLTPGVIGMLLAWLALKTRFLRSGVASILRCLGGREPGPGDLEERQLVNVAEEMAVAAGVRPPQVRILDSDSPGAAVVGTSPDDATLLVSRRLLKDLDRDETQGVVAHLTASVGNGDPYLALTVLGVSQMSGLLFTTVDALLGLSPSAWREWKLAMGWLAGRSLSPETEASLLESLAGGLHRVRDDGLFDDFPAGEGGPHRPEAPVHDGPGAGVRVARFVLWPLRLIQIVGWMIRAEMMLLTAFVIGPVVLFILRSRRYLADACAVQLTRSPDGLARALRRLGGLTEPLPGGGWADHLFVAAPSAQPAMKGFSGHLGGFVTPHPPAEKRVRRLEAQGALPRLERLRRSISWKSPGNLLVILVVAPLLVLAVWFLLAALGLAFGLALGFALFYQGVVFQLVRLLLL